ncbi:hypothetical protein ACFPYJ_21530 [Paenibacillus solisilvae]|uniref:Uncharacterized protein n=1 Tax=Paenibacillus solisilvae TaxID=2486751 RepID=A0ABW0W316_9BACL
MKQMDPYVEQLFEATGDLLYRVRMYDRELSNSLEISQMDETYRTIKNSKWVMGSELLRDRTILKLQQMKFRLVTMMENLLYTA